MLNTEKQETFNQIERYSNCNQNATHPATTEQTLTKKMIVENIKRMMSVNQTVLNSLRNKNWEKVKEKTKKNKIK